jgi:hypothetical protein
VVSETDDDLAGVLRQARARLAGLTGLPAGERERLHRQFIAVCDAAKMPGADPGACRRRLEAFLAALDNRHGGKSGNKD